MAVDSIAYHLEELRIASDPSDRRRVAPPIAASDVRILDVGCGAGQTLLACNPSERVRAVGVDVELGPLSLGRRLHHPLEFVCARGEALPIRSGCFDLVVCRVALPYMHTGRALSEMSRVLKSGGTIWLVLHPCSFAVKELFRHTKRGEVKAAMHRLYVIANGVLSHLFDRQLRWPFGSRGYESFQTRRSIRRSLELAGFEDICVRNDAFFVASARKRQGSQCCA